MDPRAGLEDSEEINLLPVPGMEPVSFDYPTSSLVTILSDSEMKCTCLDFNVL